MPDSVSAFRRRVLRAAVWVVPALLVVQLLTIVAAMVRTPAGFGGAAPSLVTVLTQIVVIFVTWAVLATLLRIDERLDRLPPPPPAE